MWLGSTPGPGGSRRYLRLERLLPELQEDRGLVQALVEELARWSGRVHPGLLQVEESLAADVGALGVVLEWVPGLDLEAVLATAAGRTLPVGLVCRLVRDVALVVHALHVEGPAPLFGHDVSPGRIWLSHDGGTWLLPSPLTRVARSRWWDRVGRVKAARGYRSPEEVRGEALGARSDVFSLGVLLHELLTGKRLFEAPTYAQTGAAILELSIDPPDAGSEWVSGQLSAMVMRALARDAGERYPSALRFAQALEGAAGRLLFSGQQSELFLRERCAEELSSLQGLIGGALPPTLRTSTPPRVEVPLAAAELSPGVGLGLDEEAHSFSPRRTVLPNIVGTLLFTTLLAVVAYRYVVPDRRNSEDDGRMVELEMFDEGGGLFGPGKVTVKQAAQPPPQVLPAPLPSPALGPASNRSDPAAPAAPVEGGEDKVRPRRRAKRGVLTLVTVPEALVRDGARSLGRTPLFDVSLREGTHLLTLEGPDGVRHVLSVPIRAGRSVKLRLNLAELPREQLGP